MMMISIINNPRQYDSAVETKPWKYPRLQWRYWRIVPSKPERWVFQPIFRVADGLENPSFKFRWRDAPLQSKLIVGISSLQGFVSTAEESAIVVLVRVNTNRAVLQFALYCSILQFSRHIACSVAIVFPTNL